MFEKEFSQRTEKPWGYEILLSPPQAPTVAKMLHINAGCKFSLQYHEEKEETITLISGEAKITYGETQESLTEEIMALQKGYFLPKNFIHRIEAITDCDLFESSTKETGKTIRLQDDYEREDEIKL